MTHYVYPNNFPELLKDLGNYKTSVSCLYINKLNDVDRGVLEKPIATSYKWSIKEFGNK